MIPYGKHHIDEEDIKAVVDVLRSGSLTQGPVIESFELAIANYVGAKYAVAVSSGTAALHLAAIVAGVGPGKALITSPITFIASANAGLYCGGEVKLADIDSTSVNMSPASLKLSLEKNPNTKAVIPVHFSGLPCDMPSIKNLADNAGAIVIEDAAHALGAFYADGSRVGCCAHSLMTTFSFHPVKSIAAGEGGMITTNDEQTYRRLLRLRSHGINKLDDLLIETDQSQTNGKINPWYYEMQELGFHYRITDIQSALALSQLSKLDQFISRRRELVKIYDDAFSKLSNCYPVQISGRGISSHHLYVVRIQFDKLKISRREIMNKLKSMGIGTQVHYIPVPLHPYYKKFKFFSVDYQNAIEYYAEALSLPLYYDLDKSQQNYVITCVSELLNSAK